jgi:predicted phage tail protein
MAGNGQNYVTWPYFVTIIGPLACSLIGASWLLVSSHASLKQHEGSVGQVEMEYMRDAINLLREEIRDMRQELSKARMRIITPSTTQKAIGKPPVRPLPPTGSNDADTIDIEPE